MPEEGFTSVCMKETELWLGILAPKVYPQIIVITLKIENPERPARIGGWQVAWETKQNIVSMS